MSSTSLPSRSLVVDTVRAHRWGITAWIVGGAVAMVTEAAGFTSEVDRFAGGAKAMATSLQTTVQAMRLLRWPADRLDTLGGFLTYHNVTLFALGLSLYAAVQGARAVRGAEASGVPAEILATGRSRPGVLLDRAVGFGLSLALICLGLGGGIAVAMAAYGEPDLAGSFVTALALGLCAFTGYAVGVLVSQLTPSARASTGVAALLLTFLYLLNNVWQDLGWLGAIRFVSPFYYFNFSRALVPGYGLDVPSSVGLLVASLILLGGAAWAFQRRDYGAGLWTRRSRPARPVRRVQRPALRTIWSATLLRQRLSLLTWAGAAAATLALMAWLEPAMEDAWNEFQYTQRLIDAGADVSIADDYLAFAGQLVVPIVTAYVIAQAAGWVSDLKQGRVELMLACPLSWPQLVWQRVLAVLAGTAAITAAAVAGLVVAAAAVGIGVSVAGLARLAADTVLLAAALAAIAALVVAWLRSTAAVTVLAIFVAASYLLVLLTPMFAWPDWVTRASVFGAYGNPYLETPAWTGLAVLAVLAVVGGLSAASVARRSPKVAT